MLGLGNPGPEYRNTRHNVGCRVVDALASEAGIAVDRRSRLSRTGRGRIGSEDVVLAKPRTFMNESGRAAQALLAEAGATPAELLVVVDDMDLPLGRLRMRPNGSTGGHRGLQSVEACLGTLDYPRLRVGIGRPEGRGAVDHVLSSGGTSERERLELSVARAAEAARCWIMEGIESAMNRFNGEPQETEGKEGEREGL